MRIFFKNERGEFAIDAIFGITFFMISLIAIMFMTLIIRVQSNVQYALGQTAKEISGYYYLLDKVGLAGATAGKDEATQVDKTIEQVVNFSTSARNTSDALSDVANSPIDDKTLENLQTAKENFDDSVAEFNKMKDSLKSLDGDAVGEVLSILAKTGVNKLVNNLVISLICEKLMPKYLSPGNKENIEKYYENTGISDIEFYGSQCLTDKRSVKLQISYRLNLEKYTLGFVKTSICFRQVASTAAWVHPDGSNLLSLSALGY